MLLKIVVLCGVALGTTGWVVKRRGAVGRRNERVGTGRSRRFDHSIVDGTFGARRRFPPDESHSSSDGEAAKARHRNRRWFGAATANGAAWIDPPDTEICCSDKRAPSIVVPDVEIPAPRSKIVPLNVPPLRLVLPPVTLKMM